MWRQEAREDQRRRRRWRRPGGDHLYHEHAPDGGTSGTKGNGMTLGRDCSRGRRPRQQNYCGFVKVGFIPYRRKGHDDEVCSVCAFAGLTAITLLSS